MDNVRRTLFSPDGRLVLTGGDDSTARLWEVETGRELSVLRGHEGMIEWAAFSPDGRRVVTAAEGGTVRWDLIDFGELLELAESRLPVNLTPEEAP